MPKQKDGRYRAKVTVGKDASGKSIIKYASGRTKKELEANKEELRRKYIGGAAADTAATFGKYALEWYELRKKPYISLSSRKSYARILNGHLLPELADRRMQSITANDLQALVNSKADMCKSDIGYIHSILTNVFQAAYAQGIIPRDPSVGLERPSKTQQSRRALTEAEAKAALAVAANHKHGLILHMLYYTGMRIGEVLGLQWGDVDFKDKVIHVRRDLDFKARGIGDVKTEHSIRDIPLCPELEGVLWPLRGLGSTFVVQAANGGHYNNSSFYRAWDDLVRSMAEEDSSIETKDGRSILTPHYFRHNYASVLYESGVDVLAAQRIMGHAKAQTTLDIYTHLSNNMQDKNAEKVRAAFQKK